MGMYSFGKMSSKTITPLFVLLILFIFTCRLPTNPENPENVKVSLWLKNPDADNYSKMISDSIGKKIRIMVPVTYPRFIDSARILVRSFYGVIEKDTLFKDIKRVMRSDTFYTSIIFTTSGIRVAKAIAYLNNNTINYSDSCPISIAGNLVNNKPVIEKIIGNSNPEIGKPCTLTVIATDPDIEHGQRLVFSIKNKPASANFSSKRQEFTWTPLLDDTGSVVITFIVTDNGIPALSDTLVKELVIATQLDKPSKPQRLTRINRTSGTVSFIWNRSSRAEDYQLFQSAVKSGPYELRKTTTDTSVTDNCTIESSFYYVLARNRSGTSSSDTVNSGVFDVVKSIWSTGNLSVDIKEGEAYSLSLISQCKVIPSKLVIFTLIDGNPLHDSILNINQSYVYTPSYIDSGLYDVTIKAKIDSIEDFFTLKVHVHNVNRPPSFLKEFPPEYVSFNSKEMLTIALRAIDPDGDMVSFSIKSSNLPRSGTLQFSALGDSIRWQSLESDTGRYQLLVQASDGKDTTRSTINVISTHLNAPPEWKNDTIIKQMNENDTLLMYLADSCKDPNNDPVTFTLLSSYPSGDTIVNKNIYKYIPGYQDSGMYSNISIIASDGILVDTLTINIKVNNVNRAPILSGIESFTVRPRTAALCTLKTVDPDNDKVTMFTVVIPEGALFDSISGIFFWKNPSNINNRVVFAATDGALTVTKEIRISVSTVDPPVITDTLKGLAVCPDEKVTFAITARGVEPLSYQWRKNLINLSGQTKAELVITGVTDSNSGEYSCLVTNYGGQVSSNTAQLVVYKLSISPGAGIFADPPIICENGSATLVIKSGSLGTGASLWMWFTDQKCTIPAVGVSNQTGTELIVTPGKPGIFNYYVKASGICNTVIDSIMVTVIGYPAIPSGVKASKPIIESGDSTTLIAVASEGSILKWSIDKSNGSGLSSVVVRPEQTTTYYVRSERSNCVSQWDSVKVTVKARDVTKPILKLIDPVKDSINTATSSYSVKVLSKDASGIMTVLFTMGTNTFPAVKTNDTTWNANITGLKHSLYNEIRIVARDSSLDLNIQNLTLYIKFDSTLTDSVGPVFSYISGPVSGTILSNPNVNLTYRITDPNDIDGVSWALNGTGKGNIIPSANGQYTISTSLTTYRRNTIVLNAVDKSTNHNSRTETITLDYNVAPVAKDTSFTTNINATQSIKLTANSIDGDTFTVWNVNQPARGTISGVAPLISYTPANDFFGTDSFTFTVSDGVNFSNSAKVRVIVVDTRIVPSISNHPASATVCTGKPVSFSVTATGTGPLYYQWKKDGAPIGTRGTVSTYSIASPTVSDAGSYSVTVSNSRDSITSNPAILIVNVPPSITTQPISDTVCDGDQVILSVVATGAHPLRYQWYRNSSPLGESVNFHQVTNNSLTINAQPGVSDGIYYCFITDSVTLCDIQSNQATLTISTPPVIISQPISQTIYQGDTVRTSVQASGSNLSYTWWQTGSVSPLTREPSWTMYNTSDITGSFKYYCDVSSIACTRRSDSVTITILRSPEITSQPQSVYGVLCYQSVNVYIQANGFGAISYQWINVDNSEVVSNDQSWYFVSDSPSTFRYFCKITDGSGHTIDSDVITIEVIYR